MGACASKFNVLRNAGDAPVPKDIEGLVAADDEAKRQSLGQMFEENEGEKSLVENDGKTSDQVKQEDAPEAKPQENETVKSLESVADAKYETEKAPATDGQRPVTSDEKKKEDIKPDCSSVEAVASQKIIEEKLVEIPKLEETSEKVEDKPAVEPLKTEEPEEKILEEKSVTDRKPETPEAKKTEEQKPVSDAENSKA